MKTIFLLIFIISGNACAKQDHLFIVRVKNCENLVVPGDVMLGKQKVAILRKIYSMTDKGCIGEIILNKGVTLNSAMRFHYKQVFIGDSFIEISIDSQKLKLAKQLSITDTIDVE